jgi:hypothetical protein
VASNGFARDVDEVGHSYNRSALPPPRKLGDAPRPVVLVRVCTDRRYRLARVPGLRGRV